MSHDLLDRPAATVEAELTYMAPMADKPWMLAYQAEDGDLKTSARFEIHTAAIADARPFAGELSLDREGIAFVRRPSKVKDFRDEAELDSVAHHEAAELVKDLTGARRVAVFDHTLRFKRTDVPDRTPGTLRQPVMRVHNDYTEASGPQRVRDLMGEEADELLKRRFAFINVWRPIKAPVLDTPLAVCDARSAAPSDFVGMDLIYKDRRGEIYTVLHNPDHRWLYFPKMQLDEAILIKCYDSRTDVARFAPHVAFEDPTAPPDAPPRESIEIRTVAFF